MELSYQKWRFFNECGNEILSHKCNNQKNDNKEIEANLNVLEGHAPIEFGHMLPYYEIVIFNFLY